MSQARHIRPTFEKRIQVAAFALVLAGGCSAFSPSEIELPVGAVPLIAPTTYQAWFEKTERCSGLKATYQNITWYVVPGAATFETNAGPKVGMWEKSGSVTRIVLAGRFTDHEMVVRHEMLHDILDREGHPPEYFVDRCHLTWESWGSGVS